MSKKPKIRVITLGLIQDKNRLFVSEGYDSVKNQEFYRPLGGGLDFGETSFEALKREFQEEVKGELTNIQYLGCVENIFIYNGKPGHEIIQLYGCDFSDRKFYELESLFFFEGKREVKALWIEIDRLTSGELVLVPTKLLEFVQK
ncbi:NUDIX hydrolase [Oscillatoria acuminata]|uniref:ADP-ribose pyrophosphatase n=1 Tax=Oscillatoria acuminata PCC 6304 TaxID=56110 RepID=K9TJJ6_9CYAN|nr:NUDIX hydrolase [Oscillatoria acuminata]AFY82720.1 ADP-ribose pyrophosphatase [Oscillatoria acuminata PCC 6304]